MNQTIRYFCGPNRFLSNFYYCQVAYESMVFKSVEAAYQAAKIQTDIERRYPFTLMTPKEAKRRGNAIQLDLVDWESKRVGIMYELLRIKFKHPLLGLLLADTGSKTLIEGNRWHDQFWGKCYCDRCQGVGQNMLGELLMQLREVI